jgi:hypothetical protein
MFRIAYRSKLTPGTETRAIDAILKTATERNEALGISGAWMISDGDCLASIEGPPLAVRDVAESIWDDPRHIGFRLVAMEHTDERLFEGWPLQLVNSETVKADPELVRHEGVTWLAQFAGGADRFFKTSPASVN